MTVGAEHGMRHDALGLAELYGKSPLLRAAVDLLARVAAYPRLKVGRWTPDGFKIEHGHEALKLFYDNEFGTADAIVRLTVKRLYLTGAAYALLAPFKEKRGVGELTPMPTQCLSPVVRGAAIEGYELRRRDKRPLRLPPEEVCAVMFLDPAHVQGGITSPTETALPWLYLDQERETLQLELLRNRVVADFLESDGSTTKQQRDQLTESLDARASGEARGSTIMLPPGVGFVPGSDVGDIDFRGLNARVETRALMVFEVPGLLISALSGMDRASVQNYKSWRHVFYSETMRKLWTLLEYALTWSIFYQHGEHELEFRFDTTADDLQDEARWRQPYSRKTLLQQVASRVNSGLISPAEARKALGLPVDERASHGFASRRGKRRPPEKKTIPAREPACTIDYPKARRAKR